MQLTNQSKYLLSFCNVFTCRQTTLNSIVLLSLPNYVTWTKAVCYIRLVSAMMEVSIILKPAIIWLLWDCPIIILLITTTTPKR